MSQTPNPNSRIRFIIAGVVVAGLAWWQFHPRAPMPLTVSAVSQTESNRGSIIRLLIQVPNPDRSDTNYAVVISPRLHGMRLTVPGIRELRKGHPQMVTAFLELPGPVPTTPVIVRLISMDGQKLIGESKPLSLIGTAPHRD